MHFTTDRDNFISFQLHLNKEKDASKALEDFKALDIWDLFSRYAETFNKQADNKDSQANPQVCTFTMEGYSQLYFGMQGGHQLAALHKTFIQNFSSLFNRIINLQKKSNLQNCYQKLEAGFVIASTPIDICSSDDLLLLALMKGVKSNFSLTLLNRLHKPILDYIKQLKEESKADSAKKKVGPNKKFQAATKSMGKSTGPQPPAEK